MAIDREIPPQAQPYRDGINTAGIWQRLAAQSPQLVAKNRTFADITIVDYELAKAGSHIKELSTPLKQWSAHIQNALAALAKEIEVQTVAATKTKLNGELAAFKQRSTPLEADFSNLNKTLGELDSSYKKLKNLMTEVKNNAHQDSSLKDNVETKESVKTGLKMLEPRIKELEPAQQNLAAQFKNLLNEIKDTLPKKTQLTMVSPGQAPESPQIE